MTSELECCISSLAGALCTVRLSTDAQKLRDLQAAVESHTGIAVCCQRFVHGLVELAADCDLGDLAPGREKLRRVDLQLVRRCARSAGWLQELRNMWPEEVDAWLARAPPDAHEDREVMLAAVARSSSPCSAMSFAAAELRSDRAFVLAAVSQDSDALEGAAAELRGDRDLILAAVALDGKALQHAPAELRADREVVLAAVAQTGLALGAAGTELRADREVVLSAVRQHAWALRDASPGLQADREVVLAAVAEDGKAFRFAAPQLQADRGFVLTAVRKDARVLAFVAPELRADGEVVLAARAAQEQGWTAARRRGCPPRAQPMQ